MEARLAVIDFDTILGVWSEKLWPNRQSPIKPTSTMQYLGGYDMSIPQRFLPTFFAVLADDQIVGVNSGFQTTDAWYRSRGVWVDPNHNGHGYGRVLLKAVEDEARKLGCEMIWSIPRKTAMPFYEKCGYVRTSDWFDEGMEFGPNAYARLDL